MVTEFKLGGVALVPLSAALGLLLVIIYCSQINFFPTGLTLGDSFLFISSLLTFSFLYSVFFFIFMAAAGLWIAVFRILMEIIKNYLPFKPKPLKDSSISLEAVLGIMLNIALYYGGTAFNQDLFQLTLTLVVMAFLYLVFEQRLLSPKTNFNKSYSLVPQQQPSVFGAKNIKNYALPFAIYLMPALSGGIFGNAINITFETIGIRQINTDVKLTTDAYNSVMRKAPANSYTDGWLLGTTVLFYGVGNDAKIMLENGTTVVLPKNQIELFVNSN